MTGNTERRMAANCREKSRGRPFCFSVSHGTMKTNKLTRQGAEVLLMNSANKNNQSTKNIAGMKIAGASSCYALSKLFFGALIRGKNQGACGSMGLESPNRSSNSGVTHLVAMEQNISMRLKARCIVKG